MTSFLIVDTYYPAFLRSVYQRQPDLASLPFAEQWGAVMAECFGTADFYSSNLKRLDHEALEIVVNDEPLQRQWAREHGVKVPGLPWTVRMRRGFVPWPGRSHTWFYHILAAQVKHYRPDVLYIQDMNRFEATFLREMKAYVRLIAGQIAYPPAAPLDFGEYDMILTSFPHFVERFRQQGRRSVYFKLGFEPGVLPRLKKGELHSVVFVGGLSRVHTDRIKFLEQLAERLPVTWWGYGIDTLAPASALRPAYKGPAWALDMYEKLYNARIVLNHHINVAENYANNMRLYETTGVGSLLLTDVKDNLHLLFEPGREVVTYHSLIECAELIQYYLAHEEERQAVARAGQQRTLREHTYYHRMQELVEIVTPLLRSKN